MNEKIERIQKTLLEHELDGWAVFCHHSYDIHLKYLLEKWYSSPTLVLIKQEGKPKVITSRMEAMMIDKEVFDIEDYSKGSEFEEMLANQFKAIPAGSKIAMNFVEHMRAYMPFVPLFFAVSTFQKTFISIISRSVFTLFVNSNSRNSIWSGSMAGGRPIR